MSSTTFTEFIKTLVRPMIALSFVGMFIAALFTHQIGDIPDWLRTLGIATIIWWFADRTVQGTVDKVVTALNGNGKTPVVDGPFKTL